jgi:hypothetical protein
MDFRRLTIYFSALTVDFSALTMDFGVLTMDFGVLTMDFGVLTACMTTVEKVVDGMKSTDFFVCLHTLCYLLIIR